MDAVSQLKVSIDSYNNSLGNIHLRIGVKTYELVKGIYLETFELIIAGLSDLTIQGKSDERLSTDNFVVPFERNPWFTGRKRLLEILEGKLFEQASKKYNHRIALYGMGGIGKTQTALEYVYSHRDAYKRIYWITAVDQASLLAGYQEIARKAGLKGLISLKPVEIAEKVLNLAPPGRKLAAGH